MGIRGVVLSSIIFALVSLMPSRACAKTGGGYSIVVSMTRHSLTLFQGGRAVLTSHISGGGEYSYSYRDKHGRRHHGKAHTPRGHFHITHKIRGWHRSDLGRMYNPLYFYKGFAIHGFRSVPRRHASHGCVRVPMGLSDRIFHMIPVGTPVTVL